MAAYREVFCEREGDSLGRKEGLKSRKNRLWIFLHHKMPGLTDAGLHRRRPAAPNIRRIATFCRKSMSAIEQPQRCGDLLFGVFIGLIQCAVEAGAGAIICAHGMNPRGIKRLRAVTVQAAGEKASRLLLSVHCAKVQSTYATGSAPIMRSGRGAGWARNVQ